MKKIVGLIGIVCLAILLFVIFVKADDTIISKEEALKIGEEKYLEFLWMVDGAFNNERFNGEFIVNEKKLDNYSFDCVYNNKKDSCISKNFEESFNKLFVKRIRPQDVYGDGITFSWYTKIKDGYEFNNTSNCSVKRMGLNQSINIKEIYENKIEYLVYFDDLTVDKLFVLEKENGEWKISQAYYHDLCKLDYYIH